MAAPLLLAGGAAGAAFVYSNVAGAAVPAPAPNVAALGAPPPAGLLIDVIGAVSHPGLYRMARGDRVYDAIATAGGLTADA